MSELYPFDFSKNSELSILAKKISPQGHKILLSMAEILASKKADLGYKEMRLKQANTSLGNFKTDIYEASSPDAKSREGEIKRLKGEINELNLHIEKLKETFEKKYDKDIKPGIQDKNLEEFMKLVEDEAKRLIKLNEYLDKKSRE